MTLDAFLQNKLSERKQLNRYRQRRTIQSPQGPAVTVDGKKLISFCSNDYLGLANHPKLVEAFTVAAKKYGVGSGASHLVSGHSHEHHMLEEALVEFTGRDRAILFSTGYMANLGVVNALVGRKDAVFEDRLNHASLIDAGLSCGAEFKRYRHNDMSHLNRQLQQSRADHKLIVSDGVFSMDGDCAPLPELITQAKQANAWLMIDDAHGFGCLGESGGGIVEQYHSQQSEVPILMATLGKALGGFGAFIAGSEDLIEALIQFARTYIYTTAVPPAVAAAARASLLLVRDGQDLRDQLQKRISQFKQGTDALGLELLPSDSPIQPIILGDDASAVHASQMLENMGFWVTAIRPPTVPEGGARLRVTLSAVHTKEQVDQLLDALKKVSTVLGESKK